VLSQIVTAPVAPIARALERRQIQVRQVRGLGQVPTANPPAAGASAGQVVAWLGLLGIGVGLVGAAASDEYGQDFAYAAAAGLAACVVGAVMSQPSGSQAPVTG
jgi:hypothetical protein